jgi:hypothetical protein
MPLAASEAAALYRSFTLPGQVPHLTTLYKCLPPVTLLFTSFPLSSLYIVVYFGNRCQLLDLDALPGQLSDCGLAEVPSPASYRPQ